ncbi:PAS domain S-box protein (plasmid) [Haladaptatus sp. SPP-AMP-3]|uniref:PAS domain S-box protein n=1 Tax=Haladaptatus sp. SPP-AMP-3 TaxID=3121295 RepID=UPI003C2CE8F6
MPFHEEFPETPQILHIGVGGDGELQGIGEERTSAKEALDRLETADCIVCEHGPPECDALAVLTAVRERDASLPFFIVSDDERTVEAAFSMDVTDCVGPDSRTVLSHKIERAVTSYRNERMLSQAEAVLEGLADAVVTIDESGEIRYANEGFERVLGYDPKEIIGTSLTRVIPDRLAPVHEESLQRYVETGERRLDWDSVETIARHRDGHEIPVALSFRSEACNGDELITGTIRDISERRTVETELEASRERYRKLVAASPEAILVADTETGEIVDANAAAEELLDRPRNEICGMYQWEIHPTEHQEHYRKIFDEHANEGGISRSSEHLSVVRSDGERVPIEISANRTQLGGREVIHGIFKDVSEREARERTLESLRSATRELMTAETKTDICEIAVEAAGEELGLSLSGIYLVNNERDVLRPVAVTEATEGIPDEIPRSEDGNGPAWRAFESGELAVCEDGTDVYGADGRAVTAEQEMVIPLAEHGVFLLGSRSMAKLDEYVRDFAEILATNVQSALNRAEREETLSAQRAELVELNRINEVIRDVDRALVQATNREEIEETVVDRLASAGPYEFAWVGECEMGVETIRAVANGGDDTYLESAETTETECDCPVAEARATGRAVVIDDVTTRPEFESWTAESLDGGTHSMAAIPIRYDETCYGILAVHTDRIGAFDDREREVLVELGETMGMAIAAIESRKALVSDCVVEVEMEIESAEHYFIRVPQELDCTFTLLGTTMAPTGEIHCFITASGVSSDVVLERTARAAGIADTRLIRERNDECVFEVTYEGPSFVKALVDRGAAIGYVEADENRTRGTVELPMDASIRGVVEAVKNIAPGARVVAQREREKPEPTATEFRMQLSESLTDRQRTALETAYLAGFFEWPRDSTGEEVAELLDVSAPTFHQHLRHAQAKLLKTFFDR